jgi:hypothetical protein
MGSIAPSEPQGVVADATSSSTTRHHAACTWCPHSSAAVSRAARARDRLAAVLVFAAPAASLHRPERRLAAMTNTARLRHDLPRLVRRAFERGGRAFAWRL